MRRRSWQQQLYDWLAGDQAVLGFPAPPDLGEVSAQLAAAGYEPVPVDFTPIANKAGLMDAMRRALNLDSWFGANWDALGDALYGPETAVDRATVLILALPASGTALNRDDFATLLQIIRDVAGSGRSTLKGAVVLGGSPFHDAV